MRERHHVNDEPMYRSETTYHSNVRDFSKTCLAYNGEFGIFPVKSVISVGAFRRSHLDEFIKFP